MATTIHVDPVSRIEGHLKVAVTVDQVNGAQQVVDAKVGGTLFRGIEKILVGRGPLDAPDITQRICGVCPTSQGLAATLAVEDVTDVRIPNNARIMRNLVLGADHLHSHILHFYTLALLDFVEGPAMPPWQPSMAADKRITGAAATALVNNYVAALDYRRKAHEMGALFGGRLPHPPALIPGGITTTPRADRISRFKSYLADVAAFINNVYLRDVDTVANTYGDWFNKGEGSKNLIAYGVFDLDAAGTWKLLKRGIATNGSNAVQALNLNAIREQVTFSWYNNGNNNLAPLNGGTDPVFPKDGAYSWLKAPRYSNAAYEAGPLARMWVNGDYQRGISVMDRHVARAREAAKVAQAMNTWVNELRTADPVYTPYVVRDGTGIGLTEAPRGALGHWIKVSGGKLSHYQIVSPTCWNASPMDGAKVRGPIEQALIGLQIQNTAEPIEVLRVIHSFDPCLGCAVHVMRPGEGQRVFALGQAGS